MRRQRIWDLITLAAAVFFLYTHLFAYRYCERVERDDKLVLYLLEQVPGHAYYSARRRGT